MIREVLGLPVVEQLRLAVVLGILFIEHVLRCVIYFVWSICPLRPLMNWVYGQTRILSTCFAFELDSQKQGSDAYLHMNTKALAEHIGLKCVDYYSETADGFILRLHRLSKWESSANKRGYPVLFVHGLMMSDECFVYDSEVSAAKVLVDAGYDVWLGNYRGNKYSWRNLKKCRDQPEYWDFSIDEVGRFDVPALMRCVLQFSEYDKLVYVGYSNGAGVLMAAVQQETKLVEQIGHFVGLAPACKIKSMNKEAETLGLLYPLFLSPNSKIFFSCFGKLAMIASADQWKKILNPSMWNRIIDLCLFTLFGWGLNPNQVSTERKTNFYYHLYSTTSVKIVHHWFQMVGRGCFDRYVPQGGQGDIDNVKYDMKIMRKVPFTAFIGSKDLLTDPEWIANMMPKSNIIIVPDYTHLDFLCCSNVVDEIFPDLLKACEMASSGAYLETSMSSDDDNTNEGNDTNRFSTYKSPDMNKWGI